VLDRNESLTRGRGLSPIRHGDTHVIAVDGVLVGQFRSRHIQPSFDAGVPCVGRLAQIVSCRPVRSCVCEIGGDEERGDLCRDRKRGVPWLFLPAILGAYGTIAREKYSSSTHHRP